MLFSTTNFDFLPICKIVLKEIMQANKMQYSFGCIEFLQVQARVAKCGKLAYIISPCTYLWNTYVPPRKYYWCTRAQIRFTRSGSLTF